MTKENNQQFVHISEALLDELKKCGLNFFTSVPCKLLSELIPLLEKDKDITYTPVTREEEAVGVCAGAYLAGKKPAIVMQNSGLGNCVNAIASLLNYYNIPLVFIVSHRGTEGEKISAQVPMGKYTPHILDALEIATVVLQDATELRLLDNFVKNAFDAETPAAILLPFSFWGVL